MASGDGSRLRWNIRQTPTLRADNTGSGTSDSADTIQLDEYTYNRYIIDFKKYTFCM